MANILHEIGTPLQLAALFLLLVAGLARLAIRSGKWSASAATTRLIVNRVFQAAIAAFVLGVLAATGAPLMQRLAYGADQSLHGVVLTPDNQPVVGATVTLMTPSVQVLTNALGAFDMAIPHSRAQAIYRLQVSAPGFSTPALEVIEAAHASDIELHVQPASGEIVRRFAPSILVAQYVGVPAILLSMRVENGGRAPAAITGMRATLTGPGTTLALWPMDWTTQTPFGPYTMITQPLTVSIGGKLDLGVVLEPRVDFTPLLHAIGQLPEYATQAPCYDTIEGGPPRPPTDAAVHLATAFAAAHFLWKPGAWHVQIDVTANDVVQHDSHDFTLTDDDVAQLKASFALMQRCQAVLRAQPFGQDGSLANFVTK